MVSWIDSLIRCASRDELLGWALKPSEVRLADAEYLAPEERITLVLAAQAAREGRNLLVQSPFNSVNLAAATTAGILLADLMLRATGAELVRGDVLLVTRQIGIGIAELSQLNLARIDLGKIWQVQSAMQAVKPKGRGRPRVLIAPPQPGKLGEFELKVDAVILDATHPLALERLNEILATPLVERACRKAVVLPLGYEPEFADDQWVVWIWDFETIGQCRDQLDGETDGWGKQWHRGFLVCHDNKTDRLLDHAREKLSLLSRHAGNFPSTSLQWVWGIYHRLSTLCIPLGMFEDTAYRHLYARTIRERLEYATEQSPSDIPLQDSAIWASEWRPLVESLREAYQNLKGDYPAKFWAIAYLLDECIQNGFKKPLLLICPTQMEGNILVRELGKIVGGMHAHLHPGGLIVANPRYLAELRKRWNYEVVTTGGLVSRWRYLNCVIREITTVAYPHEVLVEQANLDYQIRVVNTLSSHTARVTALSALKLCDYPAENGFRANQEISIEYTVVSVDGIPERRGYEAGSVPVDALIRPSWVWDVADLTYVPPLSPPHQLTSGDLLNTGVAPFDGPKVELTLSDESIWIVPGDQVFDVFRIVTEELEEQLATDLQPEDILILVEDQNYSRLFDRIIEALEQHPNFTLMGVWLNLWDFAKQSALEKCESDYSLLHVELHRRGIDISEQAVRSWYHGVMGPREDRAVFAIVEISQITAAIEHRLELRAALGHVRGMRRAAGRRIRQLVKQTAVGQDVPTGITDAVDIAVEDVLAASARVIVKAVKIIED